MKIVAQHLQSEAIRRTDINERDTFGRSAFNRYYYATFLSVKNTLGSFKKEWHSMPHGDVPAVLRASVSNEIKAGRIRAQKSSDPSTVEACSKAIIAARKLADLMEKGYATRVTADYKPEVKINFQDLHNFELNTVRVKNAAEWPENAQALLRTISFAWKQVHD